MSTHRAKADAGVAGEKGSVPKSLLGRGAVSGNSDNIRFAVAEMRSAIGFHTAFVSGMLRWP